LLVQYGLFFSNLPEVVRISILIGCAYGVFSGTHTGSGGPIPPTGKRVEADYVYVMQFDGDKIRHMTKIWNDAISLKQLGWA